MYSFFLFQIAILFLEMLKLLVFLLSTVRMDFVNSRDMPVRRLWGKVVPVNFCMVPILRSKKRRKLTKLWKNDKNLIQKYFYTGETVSGFHS